MGIEMGMVCLNCDGTGGACPACEGAGTHEAVERLAGDDELRKRMARQALGEAAVIAAAERRGYERGVREAARLIESRAERLSGSTAPASIAAIERAVAAAVRALLDGQPGEEG